MVDTRIQGGFELIYQFNQITLDTDRFLLSQSGDELLENLWAGKVVTDSTLGAGLKDAPMNGVELAIGDSLAVNHLRIV